MLPRLPARSRTRLAAIDIQRFESALGEVSSSRRHGAAEGGRARTDRSFVSEPARGADHEALAAAHGRALAQGAGELAGAIRSLRSTGPRAAGLSMGDDATRSRGGVRASRRGARPCVHPDEIGSTRLAIPRRSDRTPSTAQSFAIDAPPSSAHPTRLFPDGYRPSSQVATAIYCPPATAAHADGPDHLPLDDEPQTTGEGGEAAVRASWRGSRPGVHRNERSPGDLTDAEHRPVRPGADIAKPTPSTSAPGGCWLESERVPSTSAFGITPYSAAAVVREAIAEFADFDQHHLARVS